jgi:hypothetical protein
MMKLKGQRGAARRNLENAHEVGEEGADKADQIVAVGELLEAHEKAGEM